MKTQQECWEALFAGETLEHVDSGNCYKVVNGKLLGPYMVSFQDPTQWRIKRELPFVEALRALVAGDCKAIKRKDSYTITETTFVNALSTCDFDAEWELVK